MNPLNRNSAQSLGGPKPLRLLLLQMRTFLALIVLVVVFSILMPNRFLHVNNLVILTKQVAINAILGIGVTFVILTGGIDLSVGSIVGLTGMIAGGLIYEGLILRPFGISIFFNVWIVALIALAVGVLIGLINGLLITKFNVPPFIATLGTMYMARGAALLRSNGRTFPNLVGHETLGNQGFPALGQKTFLYLPYPIWIMIGLAIIAVFLSKKTPFGRNVYAVGGNEQAARLSGVRVNKIKLLCYMISGFCASIVGLIITSQLVAAHPATGEAFEMNAIAAVVLGGTSLAGGKGTIAGTLIGAFVIGVLNNGLVLMGVTTFWQTVIKGFVIVLAVVVDQLQQRAQKQAVLQAAA
jgi:ribose/xylose/arabinose/galactoside ABC-type transport system permease subunit